MDSNLSCVNNGGPPSLIRLDRVPQLEKEAPLSKEALLALSAWQASPGEVMTVIDPESTAYRARITSLEPEQACCVPFEPLMSSVESPLQIEVYQLLPDLKRFELVIQKLTERGVARIVPLESRYSMARDERDARQQKSHLWSDVVNKTARQCQRAMLPELMPVHSFAQALASAESAELKLMICEGGTSWTFTEGIGSFKPQSIALLIGPEGGFSQEEVEQAQAVGFSPVSLGPRILCTETAAVVAATLAQSYLGDLN